VQSVCPTLREQLLNLVNRVSNAAKLAEISRAEFGDPGGEALLAVRVRGADVPVGVVVPVELQSGPVFSSLRPTSKSANSFLETAYAPSAAAWRRSAALKHCSTVHGQLVSGILKRAIARLSSSLGASRHHQMPFSSWPQIPPVFSFLKSLPSESARPAPSLSASAKIVLSSAILSAPPLPARLRMLSVPPAGRIANGMDSPGNSACQAASTIGASLAPSTNSTGCGSWLARATSFLS
jgi:hypothetical protein